MFCCDHLNGWKTQSCEHIFYFIQNEIKENIQIAEVALIVRVVLWLSSAPRNLRLAAMQEGFTVTEYSPAEVGKTNWI